MSLQIAMCVTLLEESHNRADNSTEKRVRLKGTASVIGQFRRHVIGLSFVTGAFRSVFLLRLSIHLFLIKLSVISHSVVVDFVTRYALINNEIQRSVCAKDTDCY